MNKRQKIIVSIVGITIVLLALLGITYAYYLTRIEGNTNTNSISITTADLKLEYGDGTVNILTKGNIMPDNNNPLGTKDFTVSNTGNTTIENYKVVLEYAVIDGVVPSVFKYPEDFEITLTCVSKNIETNEESGTCSGAELKWDNESVVMVTNTIDSKIRHEYSLEIYYKDSGIDQSDDMGKNLNLKVQIYGSTDTSTLNGTITGVESGYTMKLHSEPKASVLIPTSNSGEYKYKFIGVEPGEHTLYVLNKEGEEVSSETITINKGTNTNVSGNTITVKDNQSNVYITSTNSGSTLNSTATFNPYSSNINSLAYHILNNSINNLNGTIYTDVSFTKVAEEIAKYREESVYTGTSWDYGTYVDIFINSNAPSASSCTTDMIGSYLGQNGVKPTAIIIGCDKERPIISDYIEEYESSLSLTKDDYGTSYYYRGNVKDNYITFADMCWRIVRIQGDGSVKLILEDRDTTCQSMNALEDGDLNKGNWEIPTSTGGTTYTGNFGFVAYNVNSLIASDGTKNTAIRYLENYLNAQTNISISMPTTFKNFQNTFSDEEITKLKSGGFCYADRGYLRTGISNSNYTYTLLSETEKFDKQVKGENFYYDSYVRLTGENKDGFQPTLKCNGTIMDDWADNEINPTPMYVGAISMDEAVYAGAAAKKYNDNYYLLNEYFKSGKAKSNYFWTLSLYVFARTSAHLDDYGFLINNSGGFGYNHISSKSQGFRPVIILTSNVNISSGDGTIGNPYVIE